jgi:hypothetical protein
MPCGKIIVLSRKPSRLLIHIIEFTKKERKKGKGEIADALKCRMVFSPFSFLLSYLEKVFLGIT